MEYIPAQYSGSYGQKPKSKSSMSSILLKAYSDVLILSIYI